MEAVETDRDRIVIAVVVVVDPGVFRAVWNHFIEVDMTEIRGTVQGDAIAVRRRMNEDVIGQDRPSVRRETQSIRGVEQSR